MSIHPTVACAFLLLGLPVQERPQRPQGEDHEQRLAQARSLERELRGDDDPLRRVAFADWLVRAELFGEALEQLDRVLEADPDQAEARALVATIPVALPDAVGAGSDAGSSAGSNDVAGDGLDALLAQTARAGPAVRELAAQRLAAAPEIPGLHPRLLRELVHQDPRRRAFATLALRRVLPGREVRPLLGTRDPRLLRRSTSRRQPRAARRGRPGGDRPGRARARIEERDGAPPRNGGPGHDGLSGRGRAPGHPPLRPAERRGARCTTARERLRRPPARLRR